MQNVSSRFEPNKPIPAQAGIGLRSPHYRELLDKLPSLAFLEVHSENFFGEGGQPHWFLGQLRQHYALSLHGVGLSLGTADELSIAHLTKLKKLIERYEPSLVSEHLCWGAVSGRHTNDLLPLPYTEEALALMCRHVDEAQTFLRRQMLVENVSSYLQFSHSTIPEWEFVSAVAQRTGCGILLDVNNIYVNAINHGFSAAAYIRAIPSEAVQEFHLAGFDDNGLCLIDTHGKKVCAEVWQLYADAITLKGNKPTLIEWDADIPALDILLGEADKANKILSQSVGWADKPSNLSPSSESLGLSA
ncbi:MAG: DUF692 domain-containing protein, partial [Burkholderiales bacterium]